MDTSYMASATGSVSMVEAGMETLQLAIATNTKLLQLDVLFIGHSTDYFS